ncbi:MAG: phospholipase D family protein [Chloroflexota bacterium]|nr:phospholipase D family protein [Chloroflexota bacterium]
MGAGELRIVSPFIKVGALTGIPFDGSGGIRVITRFDLSDFAEGASDIGAVRKLLDCGASVRGIRNLHAKLYLFGGVRAIVTSANLTVSGLRRNREFGLVTEDGAAIGKCLAYFDELWRLGGSDLEREQLDDWDHRVTTYRASGGRLAHRPCLPDMGKALVDSGSVSGRIPQIFADAAQAFVKFTGSDYDRCSLSSTTYEWVKTSGCHWGVNYSKRPRNVEDGDVMFISRLTKEPGIRVFGRAIAVRHRDDGRDDVTKQDIERRERKERWPYYVRVHDAEFIDGTMSNGVSLRELTAELGADSFASTQRNATRGEGNTDPGRALRQQPQVRLSAQGFAWLNERLQQALDKHGAISHAKLANLDWPELL